MDDKKFLLSKDFGPKGYCHMKFPDPKGGWPLKYGIVYAHDLKTLYLADTKGNITEKYEQFESVDAMLAAGWIVD